MPVEENVGGDPQPTSFVNHQFPSQCEDRHSEMRRPVSRKKRNAKVYVHDETAKVNGRNTKAAVTAGSNNDSQSSDSDKGANGTDGEVGDTAGKTKSFLKDYSRYNDQNNGDVYRTDLPSASQIASFTTLSFPSQREDCHSDKDARSRAETTECKRGKAKKKRGEKAPFQNKDAAANCITTRTDQLTEETEDIEFSKMPVKTDAKDDPNNALNHEKKSSKGKTDSKCLVYSKKRSTNAGETAKVKGRNTKAPAGNKNGPQSSESDEGANGTDGEVATKTGKRKSFRNDYGRYNDQGIEPPKEPPAVAFKPNLDANLPDFGVRGADITPLTNWSELGLTDKMRKIIGGLCGLKTAHVASYLAPLIMEGYDVKATVRVAPEHFLIPLACKLIADEVRDEETYDEERKAVTPYAVVICANASRCDDVYRVARQILSKNHLKTRKSSGTEKTGHQFERSMQRLTEGCHVLCTTIMRAELLFNLQKMVIAEKVRYLVLDAESEDLLHDVLVDLVKGFPPNNNRQTLLLSASDVGRLGDVAAVALKEAHCELYPASDDK